VKYFNHLKQFEKNLSFFNHLRQGFQMPILKAKECPIRVQSLSKALIQNQKMLHIYYRHQQV